MRINRLTTLIILLAPLGTLVAQQAPPETAQPTDAVAAVTRQLAGELGKNIVRLNEFARTQPKVLQRRRDDFALVKLGLEKTRLLLLRYVEDEIRNSTAQKLLDETKKRLDLLGADKPFGPDAPGLVEKAYLSEIDDSAQPYYLYRPAELDLKKPVPLILFLHGYVGYMDKVNWFEMTFPEEEFTKLADAANAIVLVPFARSNTDFQGIGEKDVIDTIRKTLAETPADANRVFLGGVSMGGSGVWTVASRNPDVFAGIFPVAGRTDYYLWQRLEKAEVPRFKRLLIDKEFSITFPQNFLNLPVRCYHTSLDMLVNVEHSRTMHRALRAAGAPSKYTELTDGNHWDWSESFGDRELIRWIRNTRRERFPKTVRFKALELRQNRAYWVSIDRIDKWGTPAEVTAKRIRRNRIKVSASNVGELTLHLNRSEMKLSSNITVEINGKDHVVKLSDDGDVNVNFKLTEPSKKLFKRRGLCGPFADALNSRFILVCPTKGEAQEIKRDQILAAKFLRDWQAFSTGLARLKLDRDVNNEDVAGANLILFGNPKTNAALARIADKLPIKFADGKYIIGKHSYSDKLGLVFVYPNPLNPKRMVVVWSGIHYGEKLPVNHKYDLIPDYIIFEEQPDEDGTNWWRCAGFFDSNWQLDETLMETRGPAPPPLPEPEVEPGVPLPPD